MSLRFRRTKKIAPGVRLNFGKKGVSVRLGGRGFGVTLGMTGARVSAGIPGTGLYMTKRLAPPSGRRRPSTRSSARSVPLSVPAHPEAGTQPPKRWASATAVFILLALIGAPFAIPLAAVAALVTWRGYRAPRYVALKQIRAARKLAATDHRAADKAVRAAAARAADSWTVQREAAAYFVFRDDPVAALEYFATAIRLSPGDRRSLLLEACDVAAAAGQYAWIVETLEPHVASMRPGEDDLDAGLLAAFALANLEMGQASTALEVIKRLPLHRRNLTPPLLLGLCVRALAKHASGQKAGAKRDMERVYAADPGFPFLKKVQDRIDKGSTA